MPWAAPFYLQVIFSAEWMARPNKCLCSLRRIAPLHAESVCYVSQRRRSYWRTSLEVPLLTLATTQRVSIISNGSVIVIARTTGRQRPIYPLDGRPWIKMLRLDLSRARARAFGRLWARILPMFCFVVWSCRTESV